MHTPAECQRSPSSVPHDLEWTGLDYAGGIGGAASVPVGVFWEPGGGGRNMGRYVTASDMSDMPTEK